MIEAMKFWVRKFGIDGFRCDLAFWVPLAFWKEAISELNQLKQLFWLAESDALDHPEYMEVFDAAYTWTWMHQTLDWKKNARPLSHLRSVLDRYESAPGIPAWFTSNHDENSWNGTEYEKYGAAALPLAVHSCTWPGLPLIYSGQELPNHKRLLFFDKDEIAWKKNCELQGFYKNLLDLRASNAALDLRAPVFPLHTSANECVLAYLRKNGKDEVLVALNLSSRGVRTELTDQWVKASYRDIFTGSRFDFAAERRLELSAWGYLVLVRQ